MKIDKIILQIPVKLLKVIFFFLKIIRVKRAQRSLPKQHRKRQLSARASNTARHAVVNLTSYCQKFVLAAAAKVLYSSVNLDISMELFTTLRRGLTIPFNYARFVAIDKRRRGTFLGTKSRSRLGLSR